MEVKHYTYRFCDVCGGDGEPCISLMVDIPGGQWEVLICRGCVEKMLEKLCEPSVIKDYNS